MTLCWAWSRVQSGQLVLSLNGKVLQHSAHRTFLLFWRRIFTKTCGFAEKEEVAQLAHTCTKHQGGCRSASHPRWQEEPGVAPLNVRLAVNTLDLLSPRCTQSHTSCTVWLTAHHTGNQHHHVAAEIKWFISALLQRRVTHTDPETPS